MPYKSDENGGIWIKPVRHEPMVIENNTVIDGNPSMAVHLELSQKHVQAVAEAAGMSVEEREYMSKSIYESQIQRIKWQAQDFAHRTTVRICRELGLDPWEVLWSE
jgi:hypothetical protein